MKRSVYVVLVALSACMVAAFITTCMPMTLCGQDVYGGCPKASCQNSADCDGDMACDGNCTGAAPETLCGLKSMNNNGWGCSGLGEGNGGCNLSKPSLGTFATKQCKCTVEHTCTERTTGGTPCIIYGQCSADT